MGSPDENVAVKIIFSTIQKRFNRFLDEPETLFQNIEDKIHTINCQQHDTNQNPLQGSGLKISCGCPPRGGH